MKAKMKGKVFILEAFENHKEIDSCSAQFKSNSVGASQTSLRGYIAIVSFQKPNAGWYLMRKETFIDCVLLARTHSKMIDKKITLIFGSGSLRNIFFSRRIFEIKKQRLLRVFISAYEFFSLGR